MSDRAATKILAVPRDPNPFQERLYERMRARGSVVVYLDGPTPSRTMNIVLLPVVLLLHRLRGFTVLHVHWTFGFVPAWAGRPATARAFRLWFVLFLEMARATGYRVVWTAHNVLPHNPVFDDDEAARRSLVRRCDAIVAMNTAVADAVLRFTPACEVTVIPHGAEEPAEPVSDRPEPVAGPFVFFGRIERYKGVPDLLRAYSLATFPDDRPLVIAGSCRDSELEREIRELAAASANPVRLILRGLDDVELGDLLSGAGALVFPFRAISTSGSVLTGMRAGPPVIVPDLPAFADFPPDTLIRYGPGPDSLRRALESAAAMSDQERARMAEASGRYLRRNSWDAVAREYERHVVRIPAGSRTR